jgi:hypothetical protein
MPAFGLEEYGLPVPRRNAETWRHFDVPGMVNQDYSGATEGVGTLLFVVNVQDLMIITRNFAPVY